MISERYHSRNGESSLDRFDHMILSVLSENGRTSITELSKRIGLSKSPTQARLRRLESEGLLQATRFCLIRSFSASITSLLWKSG